MTKNIKQFFKGKTIIFIDAANLEQSVKALGWKVNYRRLKSLLRSLCDLVEIRFYSVSFGNHPHDQFLDSLRAKGYVVITKPLKIIKDGGVPEGEHRKANFDVEIAVDAVELKDKYDTFVLFSGDSDFDYLLLKLKLRGKQTIVISTRYHVSKELIQNCDKYLDLEKLRIEIARGI